MLGFWIYSEGRDDRKYEQIGYGIYLKHEKSKIFLFEQHEERYSHLFRQGKLMRSLKGRSGVQLGTC